MKNELIELSRPIEELIRLSRQIDDFDGSSNDFKNWMQRTEDCVRNDWQIVNDVSELPKHLSERPFGVPEYLSEKSSDEFERNIERGLGHLKKYIPLVQEMIHKNYGSQNPFHSYLLTKAYSAFLKLVPLGDDLFIEQLGFFCYDQGRISDELYDSICEAEKSLPDINIADYCEKVIKPGLEKHRIKI